MSAPSFAPAPVPATAPTAAPSRRPAPVRAENEPASFADVLDDAAPAETAAPVSGAKPVRSTEAAKTAAPEDDAAAPEAKLIADVIVSPPVVVQPPVLPLILTPTPNSPTPADDAATTDTAPEALLPTAPLAVQAPAEVAAPTPPFAAAIAAPAPSAAPVAPPPAALAPAAAAPGEEPATDTLDTESAPEPAAPEAPLPPRLRDIIEHAAPRSAASAQPQSTPSQVAGTPSDTGSTATTATPQSAAAEPTVTAPKPAADAPAVAALTTEATEPTQGLAPASTTDVRTNETTAQTPVLSTLSQGAIHATAQIAAQIVKKLESRSTRFEMALTPDDLGRIDISLDINSDGQLSARLAFDNPLAAADLRGRVDELRRQLTEAGFTVAEDALSFDQRDPSAGTGGFDRGQDRQSARAFGAASRLSLAAEASVVPPRWMSLTLTPERVDMKV